MQPLQFLVPLDGIDAIEPALKYAIVVLVLANMVTRENPKRFKKSRDVGAYLGLVPKQHQSGDSDPGLGISKQGDKMLRGLLLTPREVWTH